MKAKKAGNCKKCNTPFLIGQEIEKANCWVKQWVIVNCHGCAEQERLKRQANEKMNINYENLHSFVDSTLSKWTQGCPMCDNRKWNVDKEHPFSCAPSLNKDISINYNNMVISIALICDNCKFTAFINAKAEDIISNKS